jgi:hypothetical protein
MGFLVQAAVRAKAQRRKDVGIYFSKTISLSDIERRLIYAQASISPESNTRAGDGRHLPEWNS